MEERKSEIINLDNKKISKKRNLLNALRRQSGIGIAEGAVDVLSIPLLLRVPKKGITRWKSRTKAKCELKVISEASIKTP